MNDELHLKWLLGPETGALHSVSHKKPGAEAPGRHRRVELPCEQDLIRAVLALVQEYTGAGADMPVADTRHHAARAWPDLEDWIYYLSVSGKRERTLYNYERYCAGLLRAYPDTPFDEFTDKQILRVLDALPTRSRFIPRSIFNQWFQWGEKQRRPPIEANPMRWVPEIRAGKRRPVTLFTEAEVALLENLPSPDGPLWALLFGTGMRRGDAIGLQYGHVDLEHLRVMIYDGKGGKDAVIPITPDTAARVADLGLLERLAPDDHLWYRPRYSTSRQKPISSTHFDRWYRRCVELAGVRYLKPHTTRHTFHRILLEEGYTLEERQFLMRHESPEITVRQYPVVGLDDVARKRSGVA